MLQGQWALAQVTKIIIGMKEIRAYHYWISFNKLEASQMQISFGTGHRTYIYCILSQIQL